MGRRERISGDRSKKSKREENEEPEEEEESDNNTTPDESVEEDDDESGSESDGDDVYDQEDLTAALFNVNNTEEGEDESDTDDDGEKEDTNGSSLPSSPSEPYTFDLRNMLAINTDQLEVSSLYNAKIKSSGTSRNDDEIPLDPTRGVSVNVKYLLSKATDGCTQLIRALWELPTEQSDAGPLVTLPTYDGIRLPRAMPPPPPKQETKWEKFAKAKGIPLNKEKRSRKVWDETTGSWMFRHGYEKANKADKEWPIMEVGANDDPYEDPWEKQREAKRARVDKNVASRMKNEERAGNLPKGATNRAIKGRQKAYDMGKKGGQKDSPLPTGVPVDLKNSSNPNVDNKMRGKKSTIAALSAVQKSTASLGKFDKMLEGEPERKKIMTNLKKRKFENPTDKNVLKFEGQSSMKILNAVMNRGGVAKAIRKGQLAKGETAYDYEFNDGLGASSFKKKKGRGGVGKMKKLTKRRIK